MENTHESDTPPTTKGIPGMVSTPRPSDPRPDTGTLIRQHYADLAQKMKRRPSLREFEARTGFPRSTAGRYLTRDVIELLAPRPSAKSSN